MAGFYRKDVIIEVVYGRKGLNMFMFVLIITSLSLTVSYLLRFFYYLFFNRRLKFYNYICIKEYKLINISIIIMSLRIIVGSLVNWIFYFDYYVVYLSSLEKLITLGSCLGILVIGVVIIIRKFLKLYYYIYFFRSIWFLTRAYRLVYKPVNIYRIIVSELDKSWVEFIRKFLLLDL